MDLRAAGRAEGRALLAEDNDAVRETIERMLLRLGIGAVSVATGGDGLRAAQRTTFAVLVSDVDLPGCNGIVLAAAIRAIQPALPVVLITGRGFGAVQSGIVKLQPPVALLEKPFDVDGLRSALRSVMPLPPAPTSEELMRRPLRLHVDS